MSERVSEWVSGESEWVSERLGSELSLSNSSLEPLASSVLFWLDSSLSAFVASQPLCGKSVSPFAWECRVCVACVCTEARREGGWKQTAAFLRGDCVLRVFFFSFC